MKRFIWPLLLGLTCVSLGCSPAPTAQSLVPPYGCGTESGIMAVDPVILGGLDWPRVQDIFDAEAALVDKPHLIEEDSIPYHRAIQGLRDNMAPPEDARWLALWYKAPQSLSVGGKVVHGRMIVLYSALGPDGKTFFFVGTPGEKWYCAQREGVSDQLRVWSEDFDAFLSELVGPP